MPNLINPLTSKFGQTLFWNSNWALSGQSNAGYLNVFCTQAQTYLQKLLVLVARKLSRRGLVPINFKFAFASGTFMILFYIKYYVSSLFAYNIQDFLKQLSFFRLKNTRNNRSIFTNSTVFYGARLKKKTIKTKKSILFLNYSAAQKLPYYQSTNTKVLSFADQFINSSICTKKIFKNFKSQPSTFLSPNLLANPKIFAKFRGFLSVELSKYLFVKRFTAIFKPLLIACLKKLTLNQNFDVNPVCILVESDELSSSFLSQYITERLQKRFPVNKIMRTLIQKMKIAEHRGQILGFKITCSGRFERRGRASYLWESSGRSGNSSTLVPIDYTLALVTLTNSVCAVKVWLTQPTQSEKLLVI